MHKINISKNRSCPPEAAKGRVPRSLGKVHHRHGKVHRMLSHPLSTLFVQIQIHQEMTPSTLS